MPVARVRGAALDYLEAGPRDAPTVVFLHGALRDADAWAPHVAALARAGFRALALSDRGHGRSSRFEREPWDVRVEAFAEDARAWLDAVAPGPVHLVGHSRGATVAGWLAFELGHPRVASLVVASSPPTPGEAFRAHFRDRLARAEAEARPGYEAALARATFRYLSTIPETDFPAEALSQYRGPALVLEAGADPLYSPVHTMLWRAWLRNARRERLDEGGHDFPFDGGAGEAWFLARLLEHLAEASR